jgi:hypothetical protein
MIEGSSTPYKFSLVACARWEEHDIVEWIEYHLSIGVDHFYIYSNDDTPLTLFNRLHPGEYCSGELRTGTRHPAGPAGRCAPEPDHAEPRGLAVQGRTVVDYLTVPTTQQTHLVAQQNQAESLPKRLCKYR